MNRNKSQKYSPLIFMSLIRRSISPKIFTVVVFQLMVFLGGGLIFLTICACLMLMSNTVWTPPEPLEYKVVEFSACSGWDGIGAAEKQQIFRSDEEHIFACGRIETNHPILLSVYWEYEDQQIYRDIIRDVKDQFLSELTPTAQEFPPGNYELYLVIGKEIEAQAEFKIVPP